MQAGSLYYHFASKNEILEAVLHRGIEIMVHAFETAADETAGSAARDRLGRHVRRVRPRRLARGADRADRARHRAA